jgi:hypothetical protein
MVPRGQEVSGTREQEQNAAYGRVHNGREIPEDICAFTNKLDQHNFFPHLPPFRITYNTYVGGLAQIRNPFPVTVPPESLSRPHDPP